MPGTHIREVIDVIHFLLTERLCRRVLDNEQSAVIALVEPFSIERIRVLILNAEALSVFALAVPDFLKVGKPNGVVDVVLIAGLINSTINEREILYLQSAVQCLRNFHNAVFAHAIGDEVGARVQ